MENKNAKRKGKGSYNASDLSNTGRILHQSLQRTEKLPQLMRENQTITEPKRRKKTTTTQKIARNVSGGVGGFFAYVGDIVTDIAGAAKRRNNSIVLGFVSVLLVGILAFSLFLLATNKNAYEVMVGDVSMGIIQKNKNITEDDLYNTAVTKLAAQVGTRVTVNEKVSIKAVHAAKKDIVSMDYVLGNMLNNFTYKVEAAVITVNGVDMAVLKNTAEAESILDRLVDRYVPEGVNIVEKGFVETVNIENKFVDQTEIIKVEQAFGVLSANKDMESTYQVKSGDSLWKICNEHGLEMSELIEMNPGLTPESILKIGQSLVLIVPTPMLSVRTAEEVKYTEVEPKPVETRENPAQPKKYKRVLKQGRDGQREVTAHVIRVNGFETEKIAIDYETTVPPETEIWEVGSAQSTPQRSIGFFIMPTFGKVSEYFGARGGKHAGLDIAADAGTPIRAADGGKVIYAKYNTGGYGELVKIDHGGGLVTYYAHNSVLTVVPEQCVNQGEIIAYMGSTGNSTGNHLHFEVRKDGIPQNPCDYLDIIMW